MKKLLLITTLAIATSAGLASPASDDAVVACLIGNAAVSLHKQIQTHVDAHTATNVAMTYADKRYKGGARLMKEPAITCGIRSTGWRKSGSKSEEEGTTMMKKVPLRR